VPDGSSTSPALAKAMITSRTTLRCSTGNARKAIDGLALLIKARVLPFRPLLADGRHGLITETQRLGLDLQPLRDDLKLVLRAINGSRQERDRGKRKCLPFIN